MKPLGTNVIVRPLYDPPKASTGLSPGAPALYLPDSGKNSQSQQGIVVATGPLVWQVVVDDHILYHPFIQNPFRWKGRELLQVPLRHIVGRLSVNGELLPMPADVVVKPEFAPSGRPVLDEKSKLWLPRQVFDTEIPCTGKVIARGSQVWQVELGERVLYPPETGNEVGLTEVFYTIPALDILAVLETDLPVSVMATTQWR